MTEEQKPGFKIGILTMAGNILSEKPPANDSYQDFLPGSSTMAGNILGEKCFI